MDKILSLVASAGAIWFILWWFFGKRPGEAQLAEQTAGEQHAEITVDGGYQPRIVQLQAGVPAKLTFLRHDPSSCLEEVLMPDFGVSLTLPVGQRVEVQIDAPQPGTYKYTCGMQMFSGLVVVK